MVGEDGFPAKVENECHHELEYRLADDHLPHVEGNERCGFLLWFSVQDIPSRRIGS
jgi:hypothetical protein